MKIICDKTGVYEVAETQAELDQIAADQAAWAAGAVQRDARAEIDRLESQVTNRRLRDALNGAEVPVGWLAAQEALIAVERAKL